MAIAYTKALAFSPDGRTLAAASLLTDQILLWDIVARRERTRLCGHSSPVIGLAFAPEGLSLASGGLRDRAILVWDLATGGRRLRLTAPPGPVMALAYSPDGALLASASAIERSVRIWDPAAGHVVRCIASHAPALNSVAFAPDGRLLATADHDGTVQLWSVTTGRRLARLDGHADRLGGVAFSPDGRLAYSSSGGRYIGVWQDGTDSAIRVWDVETGREVRQLEGHEEMVWSVAISPDGRRVLSGGHDMTPILCDAETGAVIRRFRGTLGELDAALARATAGESASYIEVGGGRMDFPAGLAMAHRRLDALYGDG